MELFWWALTIALMLVGLVGTVLSLIPGAVVILAAAVIHHFVLGPGKVLAGLH